MGKVREELLARNAALVAALKEQASAFRRELKLQRTVQGRAAEEQGAALRREAEAALRTEHEARVWEAADLRVAVQRLEARLDDCQAKLADVPSLLQRQPPLEAGPREAPLRYRADLQELLAALQGEREARCGRDAELHERLGREVGVLARRFEEHRVALAEDMADTIEHVDQQSVKLDQGFKAERRERSQETNEIRAILSAVWQRIQDQDSKAPSGKRRKSHDQEADQQDVTTVYEMAKEALGDVVGLRQQLAEEQDSRKRDQQQLERQVRTIKAVMHEAKDAIVAG